MTVLTPNCAACGGDLLGEWRPLMGFAYHSAGRCRDLYDQRLRLMVRMKLFHDSMERRN